MTNKKTLNPNDPAIKEIMRKMSAQFEKILENYVNGDAEKKEKVYESKNFRPASKPNVINEMAIQRAVNSKALANVRDAASRRNFNETWATNVEPLPKFDDIELLHRYVAALLTFHKPCPQTMEDVESIGIFKNYAKKMIEDGSVTLEDVKKLYDNSPGFAVRQRTGTKRAASGFRKEATADYDFDHEDEKPAEQPAPAPEALGIDDEDDDITPEPEFVNNEEPEFVPEEPETIDDADEELAIAEEQPDDVQDDAEEQSDPIPTDEVHEIDNIEDLTVEDYYNPGMNASFAAHNPDHFVYRDGKIGFDIHVYDENEELLGEYTLLRDSLGKAIEDFTVITMSTLSAMSDNYFDFRISKVINVFYKSFYRKLDDEQSDQLDNRIQKFYYSVVQGAKSLDDILKAIDEMDEPEA